MCIYTQAFSQSNPAWFEYTANANKPKPIVPESQYYGVIMLGGLSSYMAYRRWKKSRLDK